MPTNIQKSYVQSAFETAWNAGYAATSFVRRHSFEVGLVHGLAGAAYETPAGFSLLAGYTGFKLLKYVVLNAVKGNDGGFVKLAGVLGFVASVGAVEIPSYLIFNNDNRSIQAYSDAKDDALQKIKTSISAGVEKAQGSATYKTYSLWDWSGVTHEVTIDAKVMRSPENPDYFNVRFDDGEFLNYHLNQPSRPPEGYESNVTELTPGGTASR